MCHLICTHRYVYTYIYMFIYVSARRPYLTNKGRLKVSSNLIDRRQYLVGIPYQDSLTVLKKEAERRFMNPRQGEIQYRERRILDINSKQALYQYQLDQRHGR